VEDSKIENENLHIQLQQQKKEAEEGKRILESLHMEAQKNIQKEREEFSARYEDLKTKLQQESFQQVEQVKLELIERIKEVERLNLQQKELKQAVEEKHKELRSWQFSNTEEIEKLKRQHEFTVNNLNQEIKNQTTMEMDKKN